MHSILRVLSIVALLGVLALEMSERSTVSAFFENQTSLDQPVSSQAFKDTFNNKPICTKLSEPMIGANFENQELLDANLSMCKMVQANFSRAIMLDAKMQNADCRGANFSYAVMSGVDVRGADLQNAVFSHTDLTGMNFNNLTKFKGARYDKFTRFPMSFVPQAYGMEKID